VTVQGCTFLFILTEHTVRYCWLLCEWARDLKSRSGLISSLWMPDITFTDFYFCNTERRMKYEKREYVLLSGTQRT